MDTRETRQKLFLEKNRVGNVVTHGTKLVWNSFRSTFKEPSNRREAVIEETTCAIRRFRLTKLGCETPRFFLQIE